MMQVVEIVPHERTRPCLSYIVNTMDTDDLAMQGARASAEMLSYQFSWNILVSAPEGLNKYNIYCKEDHLTTSYFHNRISHTDKMASLYSIRTPTLVLPGDFIPLAFPDTLVPVSPLWDPLWTRSIIAIIYILAKATSSQPHNCPCHHCPGTGLLILVWRCLFPYLL